MELHEEISRLQAEINRLKEEIVLNQEKYEVNTVLNKPDGWREVNRYNKLPKDRPFLIDFNDRTCLCNYNTATNQFVIEWYPSEWGSIVSHFNDGDLDVKGWMNIPKTEKEVGLSFLEIMKLLEEYYKD